MVVERQPAASALGNLPLSVLLERFAGRTPAPGGGAGAGLAVAAGAALTAMAARFADRQRDDAGALAARADALRAQALALMEEDLTAYAPVLEAQHAGDEAALAAALRSACETPLGLAELGAEVAEIAAGLVRTGNPQLVGDAAAGAGLAAAGARIASRLVAENVARLTDDGGRGRRAAALAERAEAAATESAV